MGVRSESEGEIQFSFLNLFTRALPFFAALLSIYWLLAKFISNAHMLHKPSSRLQILLLWSHTLSDTHSAAGISERVSISFQRLPPWVYYALTLNSRATPSIVSQIIVHRSWFSGKITFLRQTLRQHVPRLNWNKVRKVWNGQIHSLACFTKLIRFWKFEGAQRLDKKTALTS